MTASLSQTEFVALVPRFVTRTEMALLGIVVFLIANPAFIGHLLGESVQYQNNAGLSLSEVASREVSGSRSIAAAAIWASIYVVIAVKLVSDAYNKYLRVNILMSAYLLLVVGSFVWSSDPSTTLVRSIHFLGKTLVAIYIAERLPYDLIVRLLSRSLAAVVILGSAAAILMPQIGTMGYRGDVAWCGFFTHKTGFGNSAALFTIMAFYLFVSGGKRRLTYIASCIFGFYAMIMSDSSTSIVSVILGVGVLVFLYGVSFYFPNFKSRALFSGFVFFYCCVAVIFVFPALESLTGSLGRDVTLSGRTIIWGASMAVIEHKPIFGYGFSAAWNIEVIGSVLTTLGRWAPNSHNSFVQVTLELGLVGLFIFIVIIYSAFIRSTKLALKYSRELKNDFMLFTPLIFVLITQGALETSLYDGQQVNWLVIAIIFVFSNKKSVEIVN